MAINSDIQARPDTPTICEWCLEKYSSQGQQSRLPSKPCPKRCQSVAGLAHTLEYRDKYQPWLVTPSVIEENQNGWVYHHGYSPCGNSPSDNSPSLVWYRPGRHIYKDSEAYLRTILTTLTSAVMDSLRRSQNKFGKYSIILDGKNFQYACLPSISEIKRLFRMLADHFPNKMVHVFIVNVSFVGQMFINTALVFVSQEVQNKIQIVPSGESKERAKMLRTCIGSDFIPDWLGGKDEFKFNAEQYYTDSIKGSEEEGRRYLKTMPYHS